MALSPNLVADVILYATANGGRSGPTRSDLLCCPCKLQPEDDAAWDCRIDLGGKPLWPGESRHVEVAFLSGQEAAAIFKTARKFYLWEGRIIGEARVIPDNC